MRFTSPHEMNETPATFYQKLDRVTEVLWRQFWRVNYACAIQPRPFNKMPGIVDICTDLDKQFMPERIRVVQLVPDQQGHTTSQLTSTEIDGLRGRKVEIITIDARRSLHDAEPGNIQILADYFDFS